MNYIIYSNSNLKGWGDIDQEIQMWGTWDESKKNFHINTLELQAVYFC